jgi:hypothetical protein
MKLPDYGRIVAEAAATVERIGDKNLRATALREILRDQFRRLYDEDAENDEDDD